MIPDPEQESGRIEAVELKRLAKRGSMRPLLCRGNDGAHYILKPFSISQPWPLVLEWVCARLGRVLGLPIPNYRQVHVSAELAEAWNAFNERRIEPGIGFGSQQVASALEFEVSLSASIPEAMRLRVLAFDWWIRNRDRGEKNPNLLWSAETRSLHVIDHDQAAQQEDAALFWGMHVFKAAARPELPWLPPEFAAEFSAAASSLLPATVPAELPSEWTTEPEGLAWFVRQLIQSPIHAPHRDWRNHD